MAHQRVVCGDGALAGRGPPVRVVAGFLDLTRDEVDDPVEHLVVPIDRTSALAAASEAVRYLELGHTQGKVVVTVS